MSLPSNERSGSSLFFAGRRDRRTVSIRLPAWSDLFVALRLFRSLHERIREIIDILIDDKRGDRVVERLLKGGRSGFPVDATRNQRAAGKRLHRPLVVAVKF